MLFASLVLTGCAVVAPPEPAQDVAPTTGEEAEASKEASVSIEVTGDEEMDMESMAELTPEEVAKYRSDLPLAERIELAGELAMHMPINGMDQMKTMFPDLEKTRDVGDDDPLNMMMMGPESWMYSEEGDITIAVCVGANSPLHVFEGKDPSAAEVEEAKEMMMEMMKEMAAPELDAPVYEEYSDAKRTAYLGKKAHVLFFHADWCPICRVMDRNITEDLANFPAGTKILKTDYDTETDLKREYKVNIQSTIIVIDAHGDVVFKAQDPAMDDLKDAIKKSLS